MIGPALEQAAVDFIGAPAASRAAGRGGDPVAAPAALPGFVIDPAVLGPDSTTPHHLRQDRFVGLRPAVRLSLGRGWQVEGAAVAGHGRQVHSLPAGMGILTDPMTITLSGPSISPELRLVRGFALPGGTVAEVSLGAGRQISRTRTTLRSALLDVQSTATTSVPYAVGGLALNGPAGQGALQAEARLHRDRSLQLRVEMRHALGPLR